MTSNIAGAVFNLLVLAFFAVAVIGAALATYAAVSLKRREVELSRLAGEEPLTTTSVTQ